MNIEFDKDEDYEEFIKYATSTGLPQGKKWDRVREEFRKHEEIQRQSELLPAK